MRLDTAAKPIDGTRETIPVSEVRARLAHLRERNHMLTPAEVSEGRALLDMAAVAEQRPAGTFVLDGKVNAYVKSYFGKAVKLKVRGRATLFNAVYFLVDR